ncbi:MAG: hypothetical protein Q4Q07_10905 [Tissierellia bacterium]|nr:hypothetical protein [Tissierellia bacterium]
MKRLEIEIIDEIALSRAYEWFPKLFALIMEDVEEYEIEIPTNEEEDLERALRFGEIDKEKSNRWKTFVKGKDSEGLKVYILSLYRFFDKKCVPFFTLHVGGDTITQYGMKWYISLEGKNKKELRKAVKPIRKYMKYKIWE